ncbi:MAG: hypothetical protein ACKKMR_02280 [Candidatus Nealsonbacteria bacterium]
MNELFTIIGGIVLVIGSVFGLVVTNIININSAVIILFLFFILIICFNFLKTDLTGALNQLNNAIAEIQSFLKPYFEEQGREILHLLTMKPGSPLVLTDYGKKLVNESGFPKVFKENRDKIINAVKSHRPQTNYDIQEYSKNVLLNDLIDDPMMKPIKDHAFKNSINVRVILEAASLLVRDEVMKELKFNNNL